MKKSAIIIIIFFLIGILCLKIYHYKSENDLAKEFNEKRKVYCYFYETHNYGFEFSKQLQKETELACFNSATMSDMLNVLAKQLDEYDKFSNNKQITFNNIVEYYNNNHMCKQYYVE